jgi:hypothetical protein
LRFKRCFQKSIVEFGPNRIIQHLSALNFTASPHFTTSAIHAKTTLRARIAGFMTTHGSTGSTALELLLRRFYWSDSFTLMVFELAFLCVRMADFHNGYHYWHVEGTHQRGRFHSMLIVLGRRQSGHQPSFLGSVSRPDRVQ